LSSFAGEDQNIKH